MPHARSSTQNPVWSAFRQGHSFAWTCCAWLLSSSLHTRAAPPVQMGAYLQKVVQHGEHCSCFSEFLIPAWECFIAPLCSYILYIILICIVGFNWYQCINGLKSTHIQTLSRLHLSGSPIYRQRLPFNSLRVCTSRCCYWVRASIADWCQWRCKKIEALVVAAWGSQFFPTTLRAWGSRTLSFCWNSCEPLSQPVQLCIARSWREWSALIQYIFKVIIIEDLREWKSDLFDFRSRHPFGQAEMEEERGPLARRQARVSRLNTQHADARKQSFVGRAACDGCHGWERLEVGWVASVGPEAHFHQTWSRLMTLMMEIVASCYIVDINFLCQGW